MWCMERTEPCGKRRPYVIDYALIPEPDSDRRLLVGLDSCGHVWVSLTDALRNSGLTDAPPTYRATVIGLGGGRVVRPRLAPGRVRAMLPLMVDAPGCAALIAHTGRAGLLTHRSDVRRWIDHTLGIYSLVGVNAAPVVYPWPEEVAA